MRSVVPVEVSEMPRPPSDSVQIAIRVPKDWLDDADEIASVISRPGFQASRTDAFRAAIARGFEILRAEGTPSAAPFAGSARGERRTIPADRKSEPKPRKR
jgi:hypothetical protein